MHIHLGQFRQLLVPLTSHVPCSGPYLLLGGIFKPFSAKTTPYDLSRDQPAEPGSSPTAQILNLLQGWMQKFTDWSWRMAIAPFRESCGWHRAAWETAPAVLWPVWAAVLSRTTETCVLLQAGFCKTWAFLIKGGTSIPSAPRITVQQATAPQPVLLLRAFLSLIL